VKTYTLYGCTDQDIESARQIIQDTFGILLKAHESSYHCGAYYRFGDIGKEHFILQYNYDNLEQEWTENAFQIYPLLLYVNETARAEDLESKLTSNQKFKLLKREQL
jgi:hypothetical protein